MIVTFCGHTQFSKSEEYEQQILAFLEEKVGDQPADMYLGGYGSFDSFAYDCCKKYKETHPNVSLVFVTPYLTIDYQKNHLDYQKTRYDSILYPEIEDTKINQIVYYRTIHCFCKHVGYMRNAIMQILGNVIERKFFGNMFF